ncbi:MAG TPA: hypothetical protein VHT28_08025 [Silvibacterium sp.]|nr:hypothetical protein [Silvibacterium sp.]
MKKALVAVTAALGVLLTAGCSIQVDKNKNGKDKNVKIDTPLGGLHVRADDTSAADIGLPVYPGAHIAPDKDGDKSADVHLGFGGWQLRVKVVTYDTDDPQDKVIAFYQKALGRYGDVIRCDGDQPVGTPAVTREGLTCSDDKGNAHVHGSDDSRLSLKAGSKHHQHIFGIEKRSGSGTRFSLVELQLPTGVETSSSESN